jgi:hypothetical protein
VDVRDVVSRENATLILSAGPVLQPSGRSSGMAIVATDLVNALCRRTFGREVVCHLAYPQRRQCSSALDTLAFG